MIDPHLEQAELGCGDTASLLGYEIGRFGEQITPFNMHEEPVAEFITKCVLPNGQHALAGVLETDPQQEFSVIQAVGKLTPEQFEQCRAQIKFFVFRLCAPLELTAAMLMPLDERGLFIEAWTAVINSIFRWPWQILGFAFAMNIMYNSNFID